MNNPKQVLYHDQLVDKSWHDKIVALENKNRELLAELKKSEAKAKKKCRSVYRKYLMR